MDFSLILCGEKNFYRTAIVFLRTAISIDKTKASVSKLSFDTDANYIVYGYSSSKKDITC